MKSTKKGTIMMSRTSAYTLDLIIISVIKMRSSNPICVSVRATCILMVNPVASITGDSNWKVLLMNL